MAIFTSAGFLDANFWNSSKWSFPDRWKELYQQDEISNSSVEIQGSNTLYLPDIVQQ